MSGARDEQLQGAYLVGLQATAGGGRRAAG